MSELMLGLGGSPKARQRRAKGKVLVCKTSPAVGGGWSADLIFEKVNTSWQNKKKRRGRYTFKLILCYYNADDELKRLLTNFIFEPDKSEFFIHHAVDPEGDFAYLVDNDLAERRGQNGLIVNNTDAFNPEKLENIRTQILESLSRDNFSLWRMTKDATPRPFHRINEFGRLHFVPEKYL